MPAASSTELHTLAFIQPHLYKDSVALMRVAQHLLALPGVVNATLQLGNPANKDILLEAGLLTSQVKAAGPSDIMVVVQARSPAQADAAGEAARAQLAGQGAAAAGGGAGAVGAGATMAPRTLGMALAHGATLPIAAAGPSPLNPHIAQISVPGPYAAAEALKAVALGMNVFMFSDNVPLAQEVALKRAAQRRGVLVMGPDCGTALIAGVPLGFANAVRSGPIGLVAASGTGLQEVATQIHRLGGGISHAIGTGGRDLHADVGAITMLQGIELLARDAATRVIAIISKPPAPQVAERVLAALRAAGKPSVVLFLGAPAAPARPGKAAGTAPMRVVHTLVDCAAAALSLAGEGAKRRSLAALPAGGPPAYPLPKRPRAASTQTDLRALFSGGTFAAEAQALWARAGLAVRSNVPLDKRLRLEDPRRPSVGHTALDLGDDDFTVGRPHPMIDPSTRIERLLQDAADPCTRVILLEVVIGWGAHAEPAGELAPALQQAQRLAAAGGRRLAVVGFVCGTEDDPQGLARQEATLRAAGMVLAGNSANAAWLAGQWVT